MSPGCVTNAKALYQAKRSHITVSLITLTLCKGSIIWLNPEIESFFSQQYEDPCKLKNMSTGCEVMKTGSQVLDSICINEAEKQAVLTLIREEVHSLRSLLLFRDAFISPQKTSLSRSSRKRWRSVTGRSSLRPADKKSVR